MKEKIYGHRKFEELQASFKYNNSHKFYDSIGKTRKGFQPRTFLLKTNMEPV
jgi:hypothetical protein